MATDLPDFADRADQPDLPDLPVRAILEAMLFSSETPVTVREFAEALDRPCEAVRTILGELAEAYRRDERPFALEEVAGGWQLLTLPEYAPWLNRLRPAHRFGKLTPAALETIAIIAYKQPVTRAEVESIRGVQAGPMLRALLDRKLIRTAGRAEVLGSPMLYATTDRFLEAYGLKSIGDLPQFADFRTARETEPALPGSPVQAPPSATAPVQAPTSFTSSEPAGAPAEDAP